jgi:hypothetical protein
MGNRKLNIFCVKKSTLNVSGIFETFHYELLIPATVTTKYQINGRLSSSVLKRIDGQVDTINTVSGIYANAMNAISGSNANAMIKWMFV